MSHALVWFRRDLRLSDNPALQAALDAGHVPVPVYIHAPDEEAPWAPGAASRAWLRRSLQALDADLRARGSRLVIRRGDSLSEIEKLIAETRAEALHWNRLYEPASIARDTRIKQGLKSRGLVVESHNAALLAEPWTVQTGQGAPYRVFTPFWKNVRPRLSVLPVPAAPARLPAPPVDLLSFDADDLGLAPPANEPRWDEGFWAHWQPGEAGAAELLDAFLEGAAHGYKEQRNYPDRIATSKLSPHLHFGEVSPRAVVSAVLARDWPAAVKPDIEHFLSELGWREFSHHLLFHFPHTAQDNLNPRFEDFDWADPDPRLLEAWRRGRTGVPIVDAGMRELWATGWMHNRVRMVVASFLTKNLRCHWRHGADWFWDTLVDADLANNTQGWQWTAGTGADAAPYFRIFSPVAQAEKFDPAGKYVRRWVPELAKLPDSALSAPWEHADLLARLAPAYPRRPVVDLRASREAALAAYSGPKTRPPA
ncbi:cryptochrome/photolyase family protein [Arenimonas caeni]|jgi:deoxyribodipyrimidine photo-lyase|uniref:Deoxyribodipyrimidine photo-lyase n=1 Tax=Arenimonas caeni TaxID=2058085 RepID=A0A2P6M823_9GAMM|nr:deoxyribodipyrimidine photo-lyase [Arenimonas caeni]MDY0023181.1 deoxyribodipyrimidine photo-lyase [Arenimonas caeni]PRH82147.1 deoxyribodipyrimidine photolyase [Arenimonas caeni]